jgi:putative MATE family efflux protein
MPQASPVSRLAARPATVRAVQPPARASHREIAALSIPAMAALAADPLLSLVDTALVGRLGAVPLAALGVNVAVFTTMFWGFNFLTYGTTAEVARLRGAGQPEAAARYALQALWLAVGLGLAVLVVLQVLGPAILGAMGAGADLQGDALAYLRVRALAAVPVLIVAVGHGAFRGLKDTRTPLWVAAGANGVNAVASWALIYPAGLGIVGAAWGTVLAQTGAALAFLLLARGRFPTPGLRVDPSAMRRIAVISRDLFLRTAALQAGLLVATAAATRLGTTTVAAHQIARELWVMLALVLDGFAIAGQALIATSLGAGRPDLARADARRLTLYGLAGGALIGLGYLALAGPLPRVFTTDPAVLAEVRDVWVLIALLQPVGGVVFVLDGVLMGAADFRFLFWSTALAALGGLVPLALLAVHLGTGLVGVWYGMVALMALRLVLTLARLRQGGWATP